MSQTPQHATSVYRKKVNTNFRAHSIIIHKGMDETSPAIAQVFINAKMSFARARIVADWISKGVPPELFIGVKDIRPPGAGLIK